MLLKPITLSLLTSAPSLTPSNVVFRLNVSRWLKSLALRASERLSTGSRPIFPSFRRKPESRRFLNVSEKRTWMPAFAGMTNSKPLDVEPRAFIRSASIQHSFYLANLALDIALS